MPLFDIPYDEVTLQQIEGLIENQVENRHLEYKRQLPGNTDTEKKDFLAVVTAIVFIKIDKKNTNKEI